jgi:hypothetical protein
MMGAMDMASSASITAAKAVTLILQISGADIERFRTMGLTS